MEKLKPNFPKGVDYDIVYDPTRFVQTSIEKVVHTLFEAVALVVLVVIIFLQTWRASIIRWWRCRCPSSAPSRCCCCSASRSTR
jgi:multidrug efflux pump subunit AcrB